jgi:hypothetical protein
MLDTTDRMELVRIVLSGNIVARLAQRKGRALKTARPSRYPPPYRIAPAWLVFLDQAESAKAVWEISTVKPTAPSQYNVR